MVYGQDNLQVSGFGNLSLVSTDSERYGYRQDISQEDGAFKDELDIHSSSSLGLQLDYAINANFDAVYQGIYRNQNEVDLDTLSSIAFIRFAPSATWSYRLGRTPLDIF